jgi:hypothetical protein
MTQTKTNLKGVPPVSSPRKPPGRKGGAVPTSPEFSFDYPQEHHEDHCKADLQPDPLSVPAISGNQVPEPCADAPNNSASSPPVPSAEESQIVVAFSQMYRSFRKKCVQELGARHEELLLRAEQSVRFLTPEFDLQQLTPSTAIQVLAVLESVVREAPLFKRHHLREAALVLVAALYDKHYDLLERLTLLESVEQSYCRLKR